MSYQPVVHAKSGKYFGAALVGTYSAVIGWNFEDEGLRRGLRGFAVRRSDFDVETNEQMRVQWLGGYKRFKDTDTGQVAAVPSSEAPFQRFRWSDYTLNAKFRYRYEVFAVRGEPTALTREEDPLVFDVTPSREDQDDLGLYVNRGVTSAMAYLDRFKNTRPADVANNGAYKWLSRGLKESLLDFIARAQADDALHVAIYEFHDMEVAAALVAAQGRGVVVDIVFDHHAEKRSTKESLHVLEQSGLGGVATKRTQTNISHNKTVVRLSGNQPREVWAGSANFSENAFNFQTNSAMVLRDPNLCEQYERYFQALKLDASKADSKTSNQQLVNAANELAGRFADKVFFSPVKGLDILDAAASIITSAKSMVLVSSPFGTGDELIAALGANGREIVEMGLVNNSAQKTIMGLRRDNTRFYPPTRLDTYLGRKWDAKAFGSHKIHAKTIVVDPFGEDPIVLIGSANFSRPSCRDNDENALLVRGAGRMAAVMGTEFLRMYDHYQSRFQIAAMSQRQAQAMKSNEALVASGKPRTPGELLDPYLKVDDSWSDTAFDPGARSHKYRDREVFSGLA